MITLIPKRKIQGSQELMNSIALEDTSRILPLDDTAVDGRTQEGITSNWAYDHAAATTGVHGITGTIVGTEDLVACTQGDVTGSRAINGTVYQNSTKIRIITIQCSFVVTNAAEHQTLTICSDANASPTAQIGQLGLTASSSALGDDFTARQAITFVVLPSNYYKATDTHTTTPSITLADWFEWDLL